MSEFNKIILSMISGFSTLIGFFFIFYKQDGKKILTKALAFASGVMITLCVIDLIPTSITFLSKKYDNKEIVIYNIIFFLIGYYFSYFLSSYLIENNKLYKVGIISTISITLHNVLEGIATYIISTVNIKLGIMFTLVVILHNIPEGISISFPIYYSTKNKRKAFIYTFISGVSEVLGSVLACIFLHKYISDLFIGILFSIISGIMTYLGINELFKTSYMSNKKLCITYSFLGSIFILIVKIFQNKI